MKTIEETCPDELAKIFQEGDDHAVGDLVRDSWEVDKLNVKDNFLKTNAKMVSLASVSSLLMVDNCRKWKAQ